MRVRVPCNRFAHLQAQMLKVSLSWARILPHGFMSFVNQDAIRYYDVINEIIANGMTLIVVLFDWDLPRNLQLLGESSAGGIVSDLCCDSIWSFRRWGMDRRRERINCIILCKTTDIFHILTLYCRDSRL